MSPLVGLALGLLIAATVAPAAEAGQLYSFGEDNSGQLGRTAAGGFDPTPSPVTLPGATGGAVAAALGIQSSLAITSTGQLFAFGDNKFGELGIPTNSGTTVANPTPEIVTLPGETGPVTSVAAGDAHCLAVTATGQLYAWGENEFGQLGSTTNNGTTAPNPTPTLVTLPGATGPITQVAAGGDFSLVLTSTGQLYGFGENQYGELGSAINNGTTTAKPTPALIGLPGATGPAVRIVAGEATSLVATSTGQLYSFGSNRWGQLGTATNNETTNPNPTPTLVTLPGVTDVSAGELHSLALTGNGQLYAWGDNFAGQLGNSALTGAEATKQNPAPAPVTLPGALGAPVQFTGGQYFSLALTSSGQLYGFGSNYSGQLGSAINNGTTAANPTPQTVPPPAGMTFTAIGHGMDAEHSLVIAEASPPAGVPPSSPRPSTPPAESVPSRAQIRDALLAQLAPKGASARLAALVRRKGYRMRFTALAAGTLVVRWYYLPKGAVLAGAEEAGADPAGNRQGEVRSCRKRDTDDRADAGWGPSARAAAPRQGHRDRELHADGARGGSGTEDVHARALTSHEVGAGARGRSIAADVERPSALRIRPRRPPLCSASGIGCASAGRLAAAD